MIEVDSWGDDMAGNAKATTAATATREHNHTTTQKAGCEPAPSRGTGLSLGNATKGESMKAEIEAGDMCPECENRFDYGTSRPGLERVTYAGYAYHLLRDIRQAARAGLEAAERGDSDCMETMQANLEAIEAEARQAIAFATGEA